MAEKKQWFVVDNNDVVIGTDDQNETKGWGSKQAAVAWAKTHCSRWTVIDQDGAERAHG
jgi:hypothetical protein